jgi:hypothetical protein
VVLTFDPKAWSSRWDAYKRGAWLWDHRLRRRLERRHGKLSYVQTWERHASGWPHLNLLVSSDELREHVSALPSEHREDANAGHGKGRLCHWTAYRRELGPLVEGSGFGQRLWCEIVDSRQSLASYLAKIAEEFSRAAFKVGDQRPLGAPPHFRRVRASRGLLPERKRVGWVQDGIDEETGEVRGHLVERSIRGGGSMTAVLANVKPETFDDRAPTWSDVADARIFQYRAAKRRLGRSEPASPRFE